MQNQISEAVNRIIMVKCLEINSLLDGIANHMMRAPVYNEVKSKLERLPKRPFLQKNGVKLFFKQIF